MAAVSRIDIWRPSSVRCASVVRPWCILFASFLHPFCVRDPILHPIRTLDALFSRNNVSIPYNNRTNTVLYLYYNCTIRELAC
jgi:hypothetical protein